LTMTAASINYQNVFLYDREAVASLEVDFID